MKKSSWIALCLWQLAFIAWDASGQSIPDKNFVGSVSLYKLIVTPDQFSRKNLLVTGFMTARFENWSICPTKEPASTRDCVWVEIYNAEMLTNEDAIRYRAKEKLWQKLDGKLVSLRGTFDSAGGGHLDMFSGSIGKITEVYSSRKRVRFLP